MVAPEPGQIGKNIHFLVDFSGSMDNEAIAAAIRQTIDIASQSVDEINIKVTVFARGYATWEGIENKKQPGWTALPDAEAIKSLHHWFEVVELDRGDTLISDPTCAALTEDIENMTLIVISDMVFGDGGTFSSSIKRMQEARNHKATFGFIGIKLANIAYTKSMLSLSRELGAWVANFARPNKHFELLFFLE